MKTIINGKEIKLFNENDIAKIYTSKVKEFLDDGYNFYFYSGSQGEDCKTCLTKDNGKTVFIIFDGELTIKDYQNYPSKEVYKMTSKIVSTKDENKTGIQFNVFDFVPLKNWNEKNYDLRYYNRQVVLKLIFKHNNSDTLCLVQDIYTGRKVNKIEELMKGVVREQDWEGLVIKFTDSKYEWKRSKNWLKVKAFQETDMYIKGVEEGTNSNKNKLGALICEVEHSTLGHIEAKVGSGYSDDERIRLWEMKDELINRVISVQYFEQTENTNTKIKSLRFPVFLELKEQGQEVNN